MYSAAAAYLFLSVVPYVQVPKYLYSVSTSTNKKHCCSLCLACQLVNVDRQSHPPLWHRFLWRCHATSSTLQWPPLRAYVCHDKTHPCGLQVHTSVSSEGPPGKIAWSHFADDQGLCKLTRRST